MEQLDRKIESYKKENDKRDTHSPNGNIMKYRLIGKSNEHTIFVEDREVRALIDTGSMISTLSEEYYALMSNKPELKSLQKDFEIYIICANGETIPYVGYTEVSIRAPFTNGNPILAPILIVPSTEYNKSVPAIIGTNMIRECANQCKQEEIQEVPIEWQTAFSSLSGSSIGTVKSTKKITIQPMETKTITGIIRKQHQFEAAVTEPLDDVNAIPAAVCPRVVSLKNPGKTSRVPVCICNLSAKVLQIPVKSNICQLQEVKVLRNIPVFEGKSFTSASASSVSSSPSASIPEKENKTISQERSLAVASAPSSASVHQY